MRPTRVSSHASGRMLAYGRGDPTVAILSLAHRFACHGLSDVPPDLSSAPVSSSIPHEKEIGREEAFFRRADHWLPA